MQVCSAPEIGWCTNSGSRLQKKNSTTNKCKHTHIASFPGPPPSFSLFAVWGKPRQRSGNEVSGHEQCCHADTSKLNINHESTVWDLHTASKIPYFYPSFTDTAKESGIKWRPTHVKDTLLQEDKSTMKWNYIVCSTNLGYAACLICVEAVKWCVVLLMPQLHCPVCTTT